VSDARRDLAVAICTYRRPDPLRQLLERLTEEAARSSALARVGVAVVDDGPDRDARSVVDAFDGRFDLGISYTNTASGNISTARNAAIDSGLALVGAGGWLCFIDDDCLPCEGWFDLLFGVRDLTGAELVTGPLRDIAPAGAPGWLTEQPFLNLMEDYDDLAEPPYGATANALIAADWLRDHPDVRFRPELGRIGGEDMVWFQAAGAAGITHRYALHAEVTTELPPSRTTYRYQLRSKLWWGNTMYVTNLAAGTSPNRLFLRGLKQFVQALATPVLAATRKRPVNARFALAAACLGLGQMVGRFGVRLDHH
jgi:glycosyltransferase involved in cell wall biosynthesis